MISDWRHETAIEVFVLEHHVDVNDDPRSILVNGKAQLGGYTDKNNGTSHATPREVFEVNEVNSRSIFFSSLFHPVGPSFHYTLITKLISLMNIIESFFYRTSHDIFIRALFNFLLITN